MKKFIPFILAAGVALVPQMAEAESHANVYASSLSLTKQAEGTYKVSYLLNAPATSAALILTDVNTAEQVFEIALSGLEIGINEQEVEIAVDPGKYAWAIRTEGEPTAAQTEPVVNPTTTSGGAYGNIDLNWTRMRGVAVDCNPTSASFGNIYATSWRAAAGRPAGVYIFTPTFKKLGSQTEINVAADAYSGEIDWQTSSSPNDAFVGEDGKVWLADWSDKNSGVYVMDPANLSAPFATIFGGERNSAGILSLDGVNIAGSSSTCCTVGKGENLRLYTFDEDVPGLLRYDLGTTELPWTVAPSKVVFGNRIDVPRLNDWWSAFPGKASRVRPDARGGLWLAQNVDGTSRAALVHINSDDVADFILDGYVTTNAGCVAVNADGSRLAMSAGSKLLLFDVDFDNEGVPSLAKLDVELQTNAPGTTPGLFGIAFDYADNIYVAELNGSNTSLSGIWMYAWPKEENAATVPGAGVLDFVSTSAVNTPIAESNLSFADGMISASGEEVAVYNLAGVKVASGAEVSTSLLARGVYIVRAGAATIKFAK